jgi:hypothetical protein
MRHTAFFLCILTGTAGSFFLTSCSVATPPVSSVPEAGNVRYTDFVHQGKAYRAKLVVEHRMPATEKDAVMAYIKAMGGVYAWNRKTGAYDVPLTRTDSSRGQRGFSVTRRPGQERLFVSEFSGGGGSGELGIPGWIGELNISLSPASNDRPDAPVTIRSQVEYRLVPNTGVEGPVLTGVRVPLSWRVTTKPDSSTGLDIAMLESIQQ